MANLGVFWFGFITLIILYYGFAAVWFSLGVLNYIPDPPFGFAFVLILLSIFQFLGPVVISIDFYLSVKNLPEMHELAGYYLIFLAFLKVVKGFVIYSGLYIACGIFGNLCQYVPSDGTASNPTHTQVWLVLYIWEMLESIVIALEGFLLSLVPDSASLAREELYKDFLQTKFGYSPNNDIRAKEMEKDLTEFRERERENKRIRNKSRSYLPSFFQFSRIPTSERFNPQLRRRQQVFRSTDDD